MKYLLLILLVCLAGCATPKEYEIWQGKKHPIKMEVLRGTKLGEMPKGAYLTKKEIKKGIAKVIYYYHEDGTLMKGNVCPCGNTYCIYGWAVNTERQMTGVPQIIERGYE